MSAGVADRSTDEEQGRPRDPAVPPAIAVPDALPATEPACLAEGRRLQSQALAEPVSVAAGAKAEFRPLPLRAGVSAAAIMAAARWTRWLEPELLGLSSLVGPGNVCVDVGAAAGIYTVSLSRLAGPSGLVHSIEPLPFAWPTWNRLLDVHTSPNVHHHRVALGSEPGEASMSVPKGRHGLVTGRSFISQNCRGLGSNEEFAQHITYPVPVSTLDSLLAAAEQDRLDFIKIDVEGAELHVLKGGSAVIESFRPAMLIEIEARHTARYQYDPEDVVDWLTERGYAMYTWQRGWHQASQISSGTRNYMFRVA